MPGRRGTLRNRSKLEVSADILTLLEKGPAPSTRVMYGANLSFDSLHQYLEFLTRSELIEEVPVPETMSKDIRSSGRCKSVYKITPKGREALKRLQASEEMFQSNSEVLT